ncbi:class I SAM-dependent methyltransferase [Capillimicrobium parvum]|uniref:Fatty acid methyltransferase n=1 Tax=Capillimicrobium parvum TaxID=2884022 RepID=A0A9E6XUC6_9ACTN|nr:class I SAM-dependent methyltransferase [Capillimicrobium parvum]UGS33921.1 putative fatty acid methyltransferase [Capillimicrobium parvum]
MSAADTAAPLVARVDELAPGARTIRIRFWDGSELPSADGDPDAPAVILRSPRALSHVAWRPGEIGVARAWVSGEVDSDGDIERILTLRTRFEGLHFGSAELALLARTARRLGALRGGKPPIPETEFRKDGRLHSLVRDRSAISHHYDVSNEFYGLVLGPSMVYSCAYFADPSESVDVAQERKLELICRKLRLTEDERFLDIGCGWGSLVIHAAREHGVRAVGVTISEAQAELARARVRGAGLADRVEIRVADYRELTDGPYDKVASVGMYEHVGRGELVAYFASVKALVRPGGLFLNHGIARIAPHVKRRPWASDATFLSRYVFPDGELSLLGTAIEAAERAGLETRDDESLREHYALTLRAWVANLAAHREQAVAIAGSERERIWRLYMTGAALAFEAGEIGVHQTVFAIPGGRHGLPLVRKGLLPHASAPSH